MIRPSANARANVGKNGAPVGIVWMWRDARAVAMTAYLAQRTMEASASAIASGVPT